MNTSAGFSAFMRAMNASASKEKSARKGTGTAFMPQKVAFIAYMTNWDNFVAI